MKRILLSVFAAAALVGCDDDPTDDDTMRVRMENASTSLTFDDVVVGFDNDTLEFGTLAPDDVTAYRSLDAGQDIVLVSLRSDGVTHTMEPAPGAISLDDDDEFTLVIDLTSGGGGIMLEVIEDD